MSPRKYEPLFELAIGGMATVYIGIARGALGFSQLVAMKKPHAHLLDHSQQREALRHEARLASLVRHANVVNVRDVEEDGQDVWLVMDYIEGASLAELLEASAQAKEAFAPAITMRIILDACAGLAAAHAATSRGGEPLALVHRDVSPQNILVGLDGVSRLADFGIAKALDGPAATAPGTIKGKLAYMAPEYIAGAAIDARADIFAVGVVIWEAFRGQRLFRGADEDETKRNVLEKKAPDLTNVGAMLGGIVARALHKSRGERFSGAAELALALEGAGDPIATAGEVSAVVRRFAGPRIEERRDRISALVDDSAVVSSLRPTFPERMPVMAASPTPTSTSNRTMLRGIFVAVALVALLALGLYGLTHTNGTGP